MENIEKNNNYDLEDKINLIYDYLYNLNSKNCFSFNKITLGKVGLEDIKIPFANPNNKEDLEFYEKSKSDILNGRFKLLSFDEDTYQLTLKKYSDQFPVNVKVSFYSDEKVTNSFNSPINNDSLFSYLLSQLVLAKKTKHILLPIINCDIKFSEIEHFTHEDVSNKKIKSAILNGDITDNCCLQLREYFFRTTNLEEYLNQNKCSYKTLLFQIIHTLAVLQSEFDGFRHNNLQLKNILVYLKKTSDSYTEYDGFRNDKFYLPNSGFDIKITNFEHASIPKYYELPKSSKSTNPNIKFADQPNPYYDLFVFLNDLLEGTTTMSSYSESNSCDAETKKFLNIVIPPHIRGLNNKNFTKNMVVVRPIDLLYDKYFEDFKNKPSKNYVQESISNHQYLTGKNIDTYMDSDNYSILGNQDKIISNTNIMTISEKLGKSEKQEKLYQSRTIRKEQVEKPKNRLSRISGGASQSSNNSEHSEKSEKSEKSFSGTRKIISNTNDNELIGGGDKPELAPYKAERNTPFVSNDQRETFKKRSFENPVREPPVLLEQKVYDTSQKPAPKSQFPPTFIPLYGQDGEVANHLLPYSQVPNQPPVQKVYNVSLSNPLGNHTSINKIYEDVLIGEPYNFTALSLFERKQLIDYLRNNILNTVDGEEMNVTGGKNSLLSYIKILDVNPFTVKKNPYIDLARNFLLYRAGYPVRFDDKNKLIGIGKPSMGLNIRMYMMSLGDLRCKTINKYINVDKFDLWREIKYYDWVRDEIVKKKVSPNFICPVLYKIDSESKIDWQKLEMLKSKGSPNETIVELRENQQKINLRHQLEKSAGLFQSLIPLQFRNQLNLDNQSKKSSDTIKPENKEDLTLNSGKVLVLLTEAPTSNIIQWSSTIYESFGSVKKMVSTGYHTPEIWKSILFQLVYACAILQKKGISMEKFSLENNIYIKDIFSDPNAVGSWIYKVDNVEYYIPNYGYILVVDSKYADIETDSSLIKSSTSTHQKYKIYGSIYSENSIFDGINLKPIILTQFKSLIDPDNFSHNMKVKGGSIPDESILDLLRKMWNNTTLDDIKDFIHEYFGEFVHNRVGTLVTKTEKDNINMMSRPNFTKGNLMVWQKRFQEYEWVVFVGDHIEPSGNVNPMKKEILTKVANDYVKLPVFTNTLYGYPENEKVLPESKQHMKYDESHIYETYNIDAIN